MFFAVVFFGASARRARAVTDAVLFQQIDDSTASNGSWYDDNWYQLGRGFAGTITSLTLEGMIDSDQYSVSSIQLMEFSDANYSQLANTYTISDNAPFDGSGFKKITFSGLTIPLDPNHYYRLDTLQGYQNRSVILEGTPGIGTAMSDYFVYGTGRVEDHYAFYPYIVANGNFNEPLVIVPGVMGSELDGAPGDAGGANSGKEIWPDVTDMANSGSDDYLNALALAPDGTQISGNAMVTPDIVREATGTYNRLLIPIPLDQTVYGNLIRTFTDIGYTEGQDLFVAPYDWRLDIASSAAAVGAVIQNAVAHSADGKINIIAHSMGGLVVKDYLAGIAATASGTAFVDKLIFDGVPQLGAPFIFKALQYGDNLGFTVGPFSVLNPSEVKSIVQNMPGVYQLLPSRRYVNVDGGYVVQDGIDDAGNETTQVLSFDETSAFFTANPSDARNAGLLAAADAFHASQDGISVNALPDGSAVSVYNIVGCQNPTPAQYVLHDDGSIDINRTNGDGSVPVDSAMNLADGYENYFMLNSENGVDHEGLVRDPQPLALMQAIVQETTSSLALEPLGISTDTEDCLLGRGAPRPATIEISVSGSSTLDVYDAAGDHTGANGAGDGEADIPGSSYDTIGGNTFVTLPASSTYTVKIKQASPSTASSIKAKVKVKKYDTSAHLATTTAYSDVPLDSASSTATLTVPASTATSTPDPILAVDEDGTGATTTVIEPDGADEPPPVHIPSSCTQH
jgi:pimeloyl-ACP methyl ester carboxylesterase